MNPRPVFFSQGQKIEKEANWVLVFFSRWHRRRRRSKADVVFVWGVLESEEEKGKNLAGGGEKGGGGIFSAREGREMGKKDRSAKNWETSFEEKMCTFLIHRFQSMHGGDGALFKRLEFAFIRNRIKSPSPRLLKKCKTSSIIKTEKQKEKKRRKNSLAKGKKLNKREVERPPGLFLLLFLPRFPAKEKERKRIKKEEGKSTGLSIFFCDSGGGRAFDRLTLLRRSRKKNLLPPPPPRFFPQKAREEEYKICHRGLYSWQGRAFFLLSYFIRRREKNMESFVLTFAARAEEEGFLWFKSARKTLRHVFNRSFDHAVASVAQELDSTLPLNTKNAYTLSQPLGENYSSRKKYQFLCGRDRGMAKLPQSHVFERNVKKKKKKTAKMGNKKRRWKKWEPNARRRPRGSSTLSKVR